MDKEQFEKFLAFQSQIDAKATQEKEQHAARISVDSIGLDDDDGMDLGGLADSKESEEYIDVEGAEMAAQISVARRSVRQSIKIKREIESEAGYQPPVVIQQPAPVNAKEPEIKYDRDFFGNIIGPAKTVDGMIEDACKDAKCMP